jgi:N-acetylneuraminate synthase
MKNIRISPTKAIGPDEPVYIIAEIGINHNGSLDNAIKLIDEAAIAGCDAVKFQKRTPELCVPKSQWNIQRDTPWGRMAYIDYRRKIELGADEYAIIDIEKFHVPLYKMASASLTDHSLIAKVKSTGKPFIVSTGMSNMEQIIEVIDIFGIEKLLLAHSTSSYPCEPKELNLYMIRTLNTLYPGTPIGYSGHETGLAPSLAAVALGACFVERHFTLDRAMWGSDQAASVEPQGMQRLVRDIRTIEIALGDGVKKVYPSEMDSMKRLRLKSTSVYQHT